MSECQHINKIGLSDGSSVFAWKCGDCGAIQTKNATTRGKWRIDELARLTAENARLREAAEWLADACEDTGWHGDGSHDDNCTICCGVQLIRNALKDHSNDPT